MSFSFAPLSKHLPLIFLGVFAAVNPSSYAADKIIESKIDQSIAAAMVHHIERAIKLELKDDLNGALKEWRIVDALSPAAKEPEMRMERLAKNIESRVEELLKQARSHHKKSEWKRANQAYLNVLGLDPNNAIAAAALKENEKNKEIAALAPAAKIPGSPPGVTRANVTSIALTINKGKNEGKNEGKNGKEIEDFSFPANPSRLTESELAFTPADVEPLPIQLSNDLSASTYSVGQ